MLLILMGSAALSAPLIEKEELSTLTDNLAILTWVTTNQASTTVVEYGIAGFSYSTQESALVNYHYATLKNLYPNTTYKYRVRSVAGDGTSTTGATKYFTTLNPPSGTLLFTFATLSDPQYADGKLDTGGARGRPYSKSAQIMDAMVSTINAFSPAFTILKGDVIESSTKPGDLYSPYGDDVSIVEGAPKYAGQESIRTKLNRLTSAEGMSKYYPIPGNHDKAAGIYSAGNWVTSNLGVLYPLMVGTNPALDSDFNYSFTYNGYRFILLDSMRSSDMKASIEATYLSNQLAAARTAGQKCFIFVHHPVTNVQVEGIPDDVIKEVTGGTLDYDKIQIMNLAEVQNLITNYRDIIAGVFSGHIHDNKYGEVTGVPCVRTSAGVQFPVSFNYYKVYTNGFIQSFVKAPYYSEIAREVITPEAGYSDTYWEQFALGPVSARNFSHTLSAANPWVARTSPANTDTGVATNSTIRITFTKAMSQTDTQNALIFNPNLPGSSYNWDATNTILTISHSGMSASTVYTVTIGAGAKDASGLSILSPYQFSFTSGTGPDLTPPAASFDRLENDTTTDPQPVFTGVSTASGAAITNIQCRIDSGSWVDATPLDGAFNSTTENFTFRSLSSLTRRATAHNIEVRCFDSAGNVNTTYTTYAFFVIGDRPEVSLTSHGTELMSSDSIETNPSFEVTAVTNKGINFVRARLNNGAPQSLTATQDPTYNFVYHANFSPTLADGTYSLKIEVADLENNLTTREATNLVVQSSQPLQVESVPLNYPNPFTDPGTGTTAISYKLSKSADVTLTIHDMLGNQIYKQTFAARSMGGSAGYNEINWDGKASDGKVVGNGIYVYLVIGEGKILGKGKLTVLK
jgi:hypothetical protein